MGAKAAVASGNIFMEKWNKLSWGKKQMNFLCKEKENIVPYTEKADAHHHCDMYLRL